MADYSLESTPQFVITIPPHKEDFEVRVMLERHMSEFTQNIKKPNMMSFKLYSYEGYRVLSSDACLRSFPPSKYEKCSDVFIFEHS